MTERLNKKKYPLCAAALALAVLLAGCAPAEGTAAATAQPTAEPTEAPPPPPGPPPRGEWLFAGGGGAPGAPRGVAAGVVPLRGGRGAGGGGRGGSRP